MAVYYRFKHSTVTESIPMDDLFITVRDLTEKIIEAKKLTRGNCGLVITDPLTNEDCVDEGTLIRRCSTVLIRRVPRRHWLPPMPIVIAPVVPTPGEQGESCESGYVQTVESGFVEVGSSITGQDMPKPTIGGGDTRGRMMGGRGFVQATPPQGYICHRCRVPGHFIQHCPTNGDPNYDIKSVKPLTGIQKSMSMTSTDGSYALPSGPVAVLRPHDTAFGKEIEGLPSASSFVDLPPELHCPLCKQVMKDAVFTSKCCFESFCDKCIREHIITKSMCVCGAADILADCLIPNKTLRDTISRMLESDYSSGKTGGSASKSQDLNSRSPQPRAPSSTHSVASKREQVSPPVQKKETTKEHKVLQKGETVSALQQTMENMGQAKVADASLLEATNKSLIDPLTDEVEQKPTSVEAVEKKKKKKANLALADAEMPRRAVKDLAAENYMMSMSSGHAAYSPYWTGINAFMPPYAGAVPYMGFGLCPVNIPFGSVLPQHPFGGQGCTMPFGTHQRNMVDLGMEFNAGPPLLNRYELTGGKATVKRKRESERHGESQGLPKNQKYGRKVSTSDEIGLMELKSKADPPVTSSEHHHHHRQRSWEGKENKTWPMAC